MGQRMFEKEKDKMVREGVQELGEEYEKKNMNLIKNLNIERSSKINSTRLMRMAERNKCIEQIKKEAKEKIASDIAKPTNQLYKDTMKKLIMQGLIKLLEKHVILKVRAQDVDMVKGMCADIEAEFSKYMKEQTEREYSVKLEMDSKPLGEENVAGGLVLMSKDKRIVCNNTLESRLHQCFEELLPFIRQELFPSI